MRHLHFVCTLLFALGGTASAQLPSDPEILRQVAPNLVRELIDSGVKKIGDIDLEEMVRNLSNVRYAVQKEPFAQSEPVSFSVPNSYDQSRVDGRYSYFKQTVYITVNPRFTQISRDPQFKLLLLHESLGAAYYIDFSYSLSTALYLLYVLPERRADLLKQMEPAFRSPFYSPHTSRYFTPAEVVYPEYFQGGGGATGVGHGGDYDGLVLKLDLIERLDRWLQPLPQLQQFTVLAQREQFLRFLLNYTDVLMDSEGFPFWLGSCGDIHVNRDYWIAHDVEHRDEIMSGLLPELIFQFERVVAWGAAGNRP